MGGYDDVVDKTSAAYRYGGYAGQAINIGLMFANPQAMASGLRSGLSWINTISRASSMTDMASQALQGNLSGVGMAALSMVPSVLRGAGSGCGATLFERGMQLYGMAGGAVSGAGKMWNGDIIGGLLDIAQAGASAYRFMQSCFAAGTKILTKRGWVAIETLHVGDEVWSKPEDEPNAPGAWKRVEELFVRTAVLLRVHVGGEEILTTAEHPFYIRDKGWVPAGFVEAGQQVVGKDGEWTAVEAVEETRKVATVYNCRVQDYHTYFVGSEEWGFSVWRHNASDKYGVPDASFKPDASISSGYKRPIGTTAAQRAAVQGEPCVVCGAVTPKQVADHIDPLCVQFYREGAVNVAAQSSVSAVQAHCPSCSSTQGGLMSGFSRRMKDALGL